MPWAARFFHCGLRHAGHAGDKTGLGAHHAVHPDVLDAQFNALVHDLIRHLRVGEDEDRIHLVGDGAQVGVARRTVKGGDARVDRVDLVAIVLEFL